MTTRSPVVLKCGVALAVSAPKALGQALIAIGPFTTTMLGE
jgi:hypothetical protein